MKAVIRPIQRTAALRRGPTGPAGTTTFSGLDGLPTTLGGYGITDAATTAALAAEITRATTAEGLLAPKNNAALTGIPTAPTAAVSTNTTQLATTAFVQAKVAALVNGAPGALDQLNELAAAMGNDANFSATMLNALAQKATLTGLQDEIDRATNEEANLWGALDNDPAFFVNVYDTISGKADNWISITAGTGLSGGGDLTTSRTLSVVFASNAEMTAGTVTNKVASPGLIGTWWTSIKSAAITFLGKITAPAVVVDAVELTASNIVSVTSSRALASTDNGKVLVVTGTAQVDLTVGSSLPTAFRCRVKNQLTGGGRLSYMTSSTTINGATNTLRVDRNSELELEWISSNAYSLTRRNLSHRADWTDERRVVLVDDFFSLNDWWNGVSGTGAIQPWVYNTGDSGVIRLKTGATSGGIATTAKGAHATVSLVSLKPWRYVAIVSLESIAADFKARAGFANLNNNYVNDIWSNGAGMGFDFTAASSANWRFYSGAGGAFTHTDTGVAAVAGAWVKLEIRSSGTDNQVYFSINGGAETLVTGAVDYLSGPAFGIISTAANDRGLLVDYVCVEGYKAR